MMNDTSKKIHAEGIEIPVYAGMTSYACQATRMTAVLGMTLATQRQTHWADSLGRNARPNILSTFHFQLSILNSPLP